MYRVIFTLANNDTEKRTLSLDVRAPNIAMAIVRWDRLPPLIAAEVYPGL